MTEKDLIITPLWFILLMIGAYLIRPYVTDQNTRRYFMPALTIRFVAAILLGVLYQFYYGGGDTFNYHTHGSVHIYEAFLDSFIKGIKLLFASGEYVTGTYEYASKIWYFGDSNSYFIIKIAAVFDLLTLGTYSATALFFATFAFSGMWALYQTFYIQFKSLHFQLALAVLFVPSVIFWGSGILKDTITMGALGWLTWFFYKVFIRKNLNIWNLVFLLFTAAIIYWIKIYILLSILPAFIIWWFSKSFKLIPSLMMRIVLFPAIIVMMGWLIYFMAETVAKENPKYALANIAETARVTAYDIRYGWGARGGEGAGYDLGVLDGTWQNMILLAPAAINVSLFRPYFWEVSNPFMVIAALESAIILIFSLIVLFGFFKRGSLINLTNYNIIFCFSFALIFAFAVGISTYNFGTLMRYKIPLMPFYLNGLILLFNEGYKWKITKKKLT